MSNDGFKVFHADADVKLFFYLKFLNVEIVYGDRSLQGLLKNV